MATEQLLNNVMQIANIITSVMIGLFAVSVAIMILTIFELKKDYKNVKKRRKERERTNLKNEENNE